MESKHEQFYSLGRNQALARIKSHEMVTNQASLLNNSESSAFPILAIAVLCIIGTLFLLLSYYVFVSKCCNNNLHLINLLRQFSISRARRIEESFIAFSPTMWNHGLDDSVIREIPIFRFKREGAEEMRIYGCVVCLNEFQEQDMLRVLPNCSHGFHLDCIDIWLQSNANCPLCRTSISGTTRHPIGQIIAPRSSPQGSHQYSESLMGGDEDFVVIELGGEDEVLFSPGQQERDSSNEVIELPRSQSPMKLEQKLGNFRVKKRQHVSIMGDECIDVREKDDQFTIQPIRRSFSLDSAADRQLYITVQAIFRQNGHHREVSSTNEECSSRVHRSFFPSWQGRGSRNAVLPIEFEF